MLRTITATRTTRRSVELPDHVRIIIEPRYHSGPFRVTRVSEKLTEDTDYATSYVVTAYGPRLTKTGKDHATQRGDRSWVSGDVIPESLLEFLAGRGALHDASIAELGEI